MSGHLSIPAAQAVERYRRGAEALRGSPFRRGNVVHLAPESADEVFVAGDLHGRGDHFEALLARADLAAHPRRHLVLQEVCHGGPTYEDGTCRSHLLLETVAELTARLAPRVHYLLSNHELAELTDFPITKQGKMLNVLFRAGMHLEYGADAEAVRESQLDFIAACPLALRLPHGLLLTHSIPKECDTVGWDAGVFGRELTAGDRAPDGEAYRLVWGRDYRAENAEAFVRLTGDALVIQGHEPCPDGYASPNRRQLILDSCGDRPACLLLPVGPALTIDDLLARVEVL